MRANVNNFVSLLRVSDASVRGSWVHCAGRRLQHSNASNVVPATVKAPAAESRPPLTDLLGRRHNYLRISLTERCNLRCQYCMPAEGVPLSLRGSLLTRGELSRLARAFAALGVDKVRLTGGEPTIRSDLADIIQDINQIEGITSIAMTTNGLVLTRRLVSLQRAGLTAINVSLDSLRAPRYEQMSRRPGLQRVLAGVDLALQLGYRPVKINTVLMKGFNDDEICDFVEFTRDREVEVRFIEFMPFSGNAWDDSKLVPHQTALRRVTEAYPDVMPCLPRPHDTARVWQVPGFAGRVGFISSMTQNFCSSCNRMRLTADGNLKVCLFGSAEVSLRDALRSGASDDDVETLIRTALSKKKAQHAARASTPAVLRPTTGGLRPKRPTASRKSTIVSRNSTTVTARKLGPISLETSHITFKPTLGSLRFIVTDAVPLTSTKVYLKTSSSQPKSSLSRSTVTSLNWKPTLSIPTAVSLTPAITPTLNRVPVRCYSTENDSVLTHLDSNGHARMVDVSDKDITPRVAEAECSLQVGPRLIRLLRDARLPKGDAFTVAQVAGVIGAKKTSELIPLCHPLPLDCVRVKIELPKGECNGGGDILVHCEVRATARTGAEMEAMTGAAVAALALYDMCKSVDKGMKVMNLRVVRKAGGRSGEWPRPPPPEIKVRPYDTTPIKPKETFAPTNIMHI